MYTRSRNHGYVFTLLYVTHGDKASTSANPSCSIAPAIRSVICFVSPENPRDTYVAPDPRARAMGFTGLSRAPSGVDFVTIPSWLVGEYCPVVSP